MHEVKAAGYTCAEAKAAGYTPLEAATAGYAADEAKRAGYPFADKAKAQGRFTTIAEAKAAGLVDELVKGDDVVDKAVAVVRERIAAGGGRRFDAAESARLNKVNAEESATLANAFVSNDFLSAMYDFNVKRGKSQLKTIFWMAKTTLPLWQPAKIGPSYAD